MHELTQTTRHGGQGLRRIEIPSRIQNELLAQEGDLTVMYRAAALNVWFHGVDVRGGVELERLEYHPTSFFQKWKRSFLCRSSDNSLFFVNDGRIRRERISCYYRGGLMGPLSQAGYVPSDALLDAMFGPIEQEIIRLQRIVARGE